MFGEIRKLVEEVSLYKLRTSFQNKLATEQNYLVNDPDTQTRNQTQINNRVSVLDFPSSKKTFRHSILKSYYVLPRVANCFISMN